MADRGMLAPCFNSLPYHLWATQEKASSDTYQANLKNNTYSFIWLWKWSSQLPKKLSLKSEKLERLNIFNSKFTGRPPINAVHHGDGGERVGSRRDDRLTALGVRGSFGWNAPLLGLFMCLWARCATAKARGILSLLRLPPLNTSQPVCRNSRGEDIPRPFPSSGTMVLPGYSKKNNN